MQEIVNDEIGAENHITFNAAKSFALCQQIPGKDHAAKRYRFIVVRLKDQQIVYEGAFSMGYVKWVGAESIEVYSGSPLVKEDRSTKAIIHVNSLQK